MNKLKQWYAQRPRQVYFAFLALCYLGLLAMHLPIRPYSDDIWYADTLRNWGNYFTLQGHYYMIWSGRLVSSALTFFLMGKAFWLWKLLNPAMVLVLCWGAARLACRQPGPRRFATALVLVFLSGAGILDYAIFWATGSLYYLWPAAGAALLLAPFFDLALRGETEIKGFAGRAALAVAASLGNEQITACILGFMALCLLGHFLQHKKLPVRHLVLLVLAAAAAVALFASPGSHSRFAEEALQYLEDTGTVFADVPLSAKMGRGFTWMFGLMVPLLYMLAMGLYTTAWARLYRPGLAAPRPRAEGVMLLALLGLALAAAFPTAMDPLWQFGNLEGLGGGGLAATLGLLLPYAFWGVFVLGLLYMLARLNPYYAFSLLAALCTLVVLFFSPAIYSSGERTLFAAAVILVAMLTALLRGKTPWPIAVPVLCLCAVNTARLLSRIQLFT